MTSGPAPSLARNEQHRPGCSSRPEDPTTDDNASLNVREIFWRDRYSFLSSKGYTLRSRYHPGWEPSWLCAPSPSRGKLGCEDWWMLPPVLGHIDAMDKGGQVVWLKAVSTSGEELHILKLFSQPTLRNDQRNHCVPILDHFRDTLDEDLTILVMPYLRKCTDPLFYYVGEVVDFVDQVLQGLAYMHENNIAHRSCTLAKIRIDATSLYPEGFHPVLTHRLMDIKKTAQPYKRLEASSSVKYYFIGFHQSASSHAGEPNVASDTFHNDHMVPEQSRAALRDPFQTDVYALGHSLLRDLYNKYNRLYFLQPLLDRMLVSDPKLRITSGEALELWRDIRQGLMPIELLMRLCPADESLEATLALDIYAAARLSVMFLTENIGKAASAVHHTLRSVI